MEQVTENYLEGEQRVCDVWARYITNNNMTMEEAAMEAVAEETETENGRID